MNPNDPIRYLPDSPAALHARGWDGCDVLLLTGDPHLDHPAFPASLVGRWLEHHGFRVALVSRPDPEKPEFLRAFGVPRLFVGVTAGALDSMVANTTATGKRRSDDPYSPFGKGPGRPDRALTAYCNLARRVFGKAVPIVAGGLEASLRRFAHYDFWSDKVRRPILMDCGADLLVHGMGEGPILELARRLAELTRINPETGASPWIGPLRDIPGLGYRLPASEPFPEGALELPSAEEVASDPMAHARAFREMERTRSRCVCQRVGGMRVVMNPPWPPLSPQELDRVHALPFTRNPHPSYGPVPFPALEQVRFSIVSHRGCFGGCAFCAISAHQGKEVQSRSRDAILAEASRIAAHPEFRGVIPDVGGPTANMYALGCTRPERCDRPSCLAPSPCRHLNSNQEPYRHLLKSVSEVRGVKKLFVTSGLRHDLLLAAPELFERIVRHHTSGHVKVAPEHLAPSVLRIMRKPAGDAFGRLVTRHRQLSAGLGKGQKVIPYLMAAHPGCTLDDMIDLALWLARENIQVEQCQIFTPTPGTAATVMYATGINPDTLEPVFVERDTRRKEIQKALILYHLPESRPLVEKALRLCGREAEARALLGPIRASKAPRRPVSGATRKNDLRPARTRKRQA